jgi:hypothetical protein
VVVHATQVQAAARGNRSGGVTGKCKMKMAK